MAASSASAGSYSSGRPVFIRSVSSRAADGQSDGRLAPTVTRQGARRDGSDRRTVRPLRAWSGASYRALSSNAGGRPDRSRSSGQILHHTRHAVVARAKRNHVATLVVTMESRSELRRCPGIRAGSCPWDRWRAPAAAQSPARSVQRADRACCISSPPRDEIARPARITLANCRSSPFHH